MSIGIADKPFSTKSSSRVTAVAMPASRAGATTRQKKTPIPTSTKADWLASQLKNSSGGFMCPCVQLCKMRAGRPPPMRVSLTPAVKNILQVVSRVQRLSGHLKGSFNNRTGSITDRGPNRERVIAGSTRFARVLGPNQGKKSTAWGLSSRRKRSHQWQLWTQNNQQGVETHAKASACGACALHAASTDPIRSRISSSTARQEVRCGARFAHVGRTQPR